MFPMSLPRQFIAWEGEDPAEPLRGWLGRSLALPKVFAELGFAKMFRLVTSASHPRGRVPASTPPAIPQLVFR